VVKHESVSHIFFIVNRPSLVQRAKKAGTHVDPASFKRNLKNLEMILREWPKIQSLGAGIGSIPPTPTKARGESPDSKDCQDSHR
jgi:hypothetical protein